MDEPTVNQPVEIDLTAQISLIILSVVQELDGTDSEALLITQMVNLCSSCGD